MNELQELRGRLAKEAVQGWIDQSPGRGGILVGRDPDDLRAECALAMARTERFMAGDQAASVWLRAVPARMDRFSVRDAEDLGVWFSRAIEKYDEARRGNRA